MDAKMKLALEKVAVEVRKDIVTAVHSAKSGHPGGSLSLTDTLTYLYFYKMNVDPANPQDPDRDRFVLSKGHTAPALYSVLAQKGFFPVDDIKTFRNAYTRMEQADSNKSTRVVFCIT